MLSNLKISAKLKILAFVAALGFFGILSGVNYSRGIVMSNYHHTKKLHDELSALKSILIGGLLVNSATNVYIIDNSKKKPLKTIKSGLAKMNKFKTALKKVDPKDYKKINILMKNFSKVANEVLTKGVKESKLEPQDSKKLLKPWRALKFHIIKMNKSIKAAVKKNDAKMSKALKKTISIILTVVVIVVILYAFISYIVSRDIVNGLHVLYRAVSGLSTSQDISNTKVTIETKDELGDIAKELNKYLHKIQNDLQESMQFIDNTRAVMGRVGHGWFSEYIDIETTNPSLNELKNAVNTALKNLKEKFVMINDTLDQYTNLKYTEVLDIKSIEKNGVFDKLLTSIGALRETITKMLVENKRNGLVLKNSSSVLLENVDKLNNNSNQTATGLEETSSALGEITNTISSSATTIAQMTDYANELSTSSKNGQELAEQTTVAMSEIDKKVTSINEAIGVIDQIAFQTNILSLNAAVEAATAGEAGKGFAVVAGEVRNLASRSAEAANEIKSLVENATSKANSGKDIAQTMIDGYSLLNENILKTLNLIEDVEESSKEQLKAIEQINNTVSLLDSQTQQNAIVASDTKDIAIKTDEMAKIIISNVNKKEFVGKDNISID